MKLIEKQLSRTDIYKGRIIEVAVDDVELENGAKAKRELVMHPGGVCVAALTDQDEMLFVRQFRYPYREVVLEVPAGKLERGEDPFEACKREQREETGTTADTYLNLGVLYPTPGYCDEILHLYACRITGYGESHLDEDEFLEVERIPLQEAVELVMDNTIKDAKTQVLVLKAALLVEQKKI